ncbi:hypothetical protein EDD17DRAFT_1770388 [Pisolithus thermaeus]|nr:hypothetical protein EDD17DRAFT_1770388 [Pisolithus thermaeus]
MPRACKECGLEFDNRNLHDAHWKKCVKVITFVAYTGQDVTITCHENGTFLCYCSHPKCPRETGFTTVDALHKHMKTLKTTWLGPEKKAGGHSLLQTANTTTSTMEITTDAPCPPQMPAIPWDETMNSPSAPSNGNAPMHSPPTALDTLWGRKRLSYGSTFRKRSLEALPIYGRKRLTATEALPLYGRKRLTATEALPLYGWKRLTATEALPIYGRKRLTATEALPIYGRKRLTATEALPLYGRKRLTATEALPIYGRKHLTATEALPSYGQKSTATMEVSLAQSVDELCRGGLVKRATTSY